MWLKKRRLRRKLSKKKFDGPKDQETQNVAPNVLVKDTDQMRPVISKELVYTNEEVCQDNEP